MALQSTLTALADPTRRAIFDTLAKNPNSVGELAGSQPVTRPAVSQHLRVLHDAGLVRVEGRGTRRVYSIDRNGLTGLRTYLDQFWDDVLDAYANEIERSQGEPND